MKIEALCRKVELILSDVDGVLTDGAIEYNNQGIETKRFHVHDGLGIRLWQRAGYRFGILTARSSHIVKLRAAELEVDIVRQGFEEKLPVAMDIIAACGLTPSQVCYIGDDLPDLPLIRIAGLGVAVANARPEIKAAADFITELPGGSGAVRETIEIVLKAKMQWDELTRRYTTPHIDRRTAM
jgi:3-deoxy-D-manno-octulosonate 8-phosphate phosphatase (KDO 8-P phosphatase)